MSLLNRSLLCLFLLLDRKLFSSRCVRVQCVRHSVYQEHAHTQTDTYIWNFQHSVLYKCRVVLRSSINRVHAYQVFTEEYNIQFYLVVTEYFIQSEC